MINFYNVAHFRTRRGLSARALNELCNYTSPNRIWRIENDVIALNEQDCSIISDALHISSRWLLDSPVLLSNQSVLDVITSIGNYCGISVKRDGSIVLPSNISDFLKDLLRRSNELSSDDFFEYLVNYSKPITIFTPNDASNKFLIDKIFTFASHRNISDYNIGIALGFDEIHALDYTIQLKLYERELNKDNIKKFISFYQLSNSFLIEQFRVSDTDSLEHALISLYESSIGHYTINADGSFYLENDVLRNFFKETSVKGVKLPLILDVT